MIAKVLISQKERYPVNVYFCFPNFARNLQIQNAAELIYLKAWSLSFDHLLEKIRGFQKNLLLILPEKRVGRCMGQFAYVWGISLRSLSVIYLFLGDILCAIYCKILFTHNIFWI